MIIYLYYYYYYYDLHGIAIAPLLCRIYDNIIENRFCIWYTPNYQQAGFWKGQGCLLQLFMLIFLFKFSKINNKNLFVAFMDYGSQLTKAMVTEYFPKLKGNKVGECNTTKFSATQGRKSSAPIIFILRKR